MRDDDPSDPVVARIFEDAFRGGGGGGRFGGYGKRRGGRDDGLPGASALLPPAAVLTLRFLLGTVAALYALNQKHLLPKPVSSAVSRALFWPTLPITVSRRIGRWMTEIDDALVLGGAPFGFAGIPDRLRDEYGVSFVSS